MREETIRKLVEISMRLNKSRDELRKATERIAGCPLPDWSITDCIRYVELGYKAKEKEKNESK